ncbi:ligand-binding sensor domain-containing protein [Flavitalea sp.]|nr:two-component regulator propeller domain-containing protein [Flavitalea sp.]
MNRLIVLVLVMIIFLSSSCKKDKLHANDEMPDPPKPEWQLYSSANSKLPDNQVNSIVIGQDNVKWIGTANGLVRIIDNAWTVFTSENSPLPSSFVQALAVQPNGSLWVGTDKGLASYSGSVWNVYTSGNSALPENPIMSITHDSKFDRIWVGTSKGLVRIENAGNWKLHDETSGDLLYSMATDQQGNLWIGAFNHFQFQGRIRKLEGDTWTAYKLNDAGYTSTYPYSIAVDKNNVVIALLTGTSVSAVVRLNGGVFEEIPKPKDAHGLKTLLLEEDKIWVGGKNLSLFGNTASHVIQIPGTDNQILAIARDKTGGKWIGMLGGGLAVYRQ